MRKILFFLMVGLLSSHGSFGQLLIGPKIGGHMGKVAFDNKLYEDQFNSNINFGFNAGGAITFPVSEPVTLHVEIIGSRKGKDLGIPQESLKNIANYYYLEMPIMMRYKILPQQGIFLGIGPNLSYWLTGNGRISNIQETSTPIDYGITFGSEGSPDDLLIADANRLQLGLLIGLGTLVQVGEDRTLLLEARLELGHSHLADAQGGNIEELEFFDNLESKHQIISFNLGYFWSIHKKNAKKKSHTYKAKQRK